MKKRIAHFWIIGLSLILCGCSSGHQTEASQGGGVLVGKLGAITKNMEAQDYLKFAQGLENNPKEEVSYWQNESATATYMLTIVKNVNDGDNPYCREYQLAVSQADKRQQVEGKACRQKDGIWKIEVSQEV